MNPKLTKAESGRWFSWDEDEQLRELVNEAFENPDTRAGAAVIVEWFERSRLVLFQYHVDKAAA